MSQQDWKQLYDSLKIELAPGTPKGVRPTPTTISEYESATAFKLPLDYREFIQVFGPGELGRVFRSKHQGIRLSAIQPILVPLTPALTNSDTIQQRLESANDRSSSNVFTSSLLRMREKRLPGILSFMTWIGRITPSTSCYAPATLQNCLPLASRSLFSMSAWGVGTPGSLPKKPTGIRRKWGLNVYSRPGSMPVVRAESRPYPSD